MEVKKISFDLINPAKYNPRRALKPGDAAYEKLKQSIESFGYLDPIIWNKRTGNIVGGHQRATVLKDLGYTEVDCVIVEMDDIEEKKLNLALNKVKGEWDKDMLSDLLQEIKNSDSPEVTGFDDAEIKKMTAGQSLVEKIAQEAEIENVRDQASDIAASFDKRVRDIAKQQPEKMASALGVIVPTAGNEVLIITDPALTDFLAEIRRYADAGIHSPLEAILEQVVSMKWS